jgi:hypothetical protein
VLPRIARWRVASLVMGGARHGAAVWPAARTPRLTSRAVLPSRAAAWPGWAAQAHFILSARPALGHFAHLAGARMVHMSLDRWAVCTLAAVHPCCRQAGAVPGSFTCTRSHRHVRAPPRRAQDGGLCSSGRRVGACSVRVAVETWRAGAAPVHRPRLHTSLERWVSPVVGPPAQQGAVAQLRLRCLSWRPGQAGPACSHPVQAASRQQPGTNRPGSPLRAPLASSKFAAPATPAAGRVWLGTHQRACLSLPCGSQRRPLLVLLRGNQKHPPARPMRH